VKMLVPAPGRVACLSAIVAAWAVSASAQTAPKPAAPAQVPTGAPEAPAGVVPPDGYVIGADDVLTVVFWRDKDMTQDVAVRPDGKISLPLLNEVQAAGLTPEQLRERVTEASKRFFESPTVSVVVKQINSRKVYITGQVGKPGTYPLMGPMTVLQLITVAGGVLEYAKQDDIGIIRTESGKQTRLRFNYKDVTRGKNLEQNIELKPGDQIVVP
jgi:polysaccharide biosynthesis/export protein